MGKDDRIEALLIEWAQWVKVGDGSGYSTMSVLSADWMPPTPGMTPTMKTSRHSTAQATHRAITQLSQRIRNTLVVHYVQRPALSIAQQAERLDCADSTVLARVTFAHRELRRILFG